MAPQTKVNNPMKTTKSILKEMSITIREILLKILHKITSKFTIHRSSQIEGDLDIKAIRYLDFTINKIDTDTLDSLTAELPRRTKEDSHLRNPSSKATEPMPTIYKAK